jgi:hypothetical protein
LNDSRFTGQRRAEQGTKPPGLGEEGFDDEVQLIEKYLVEGDPEDGEKETVNEMSSIHKVYNDWKTEERARIE